MDEIAIQVESISKRYRIGIQDEQPETIVAAMASWARSPVHNFQRLRRLANFTENGHDAEDIIWALNEVSFDVRRGEVVGIIGSNGAGKTTLLKILSRITEPTSGRALINGRVSSLLEVGTGFHPELTGRENVYLNGTVLGMSKQEVERKFDEIVDFSGVEQFIDTPVKRYSSGMQVRLAFAVAAHLEPEILLVDEVLAVGDAEFQKKCIGKMGDAALEGRTVLFVSHNLAAIQKLCSRAIVLGAGKIIKDDEPNSSISTYMENVFPADEISTGLNANDRPGTGVVRLTDFYIVDEQGNQTRTLIGGSTYRFCFVLKANEDIRWERVRVGFSLGTMQQVMLTYFDNTFTNDQYTNETGERLVYVCQVPRFSLIAGKYIVLSNVMYSGQKADIPGHIATINVEKGGYYPSGKQSTRNPVMLDYEWTIE